MDELEKQQHMETPPASVSLEQLHQMLANQSEQLAQLSGQLASLHSAVGGPAGMAGMGAVGVAKSQPARLPRQAGLSEQLHQAARQAAATGKRADVLAFLKIRRIAAGR